MDSRTRNMVLMAGAIGLAGCVLGACNITGPAFLAIHGPAKTPAQYTLPGERPVIVFIDDRGNFLPRRNLREIIATSCSQFLLDDGAVSKVIDAKAALAASTGEKPGQPTDLVTLTKTCQAEIMIFATVDNFALSSDGATVEPTATLRVKVIDALAKNPRLWPEEREGKSIKVTRPVNAGATPRSSGEIIGAEEELARQIGRSLAELFYEHETARSITER